MVCWAFSVCLGMCRKQSGPGLEMVTAQIIREDLVGCIIFCRFKSSQWHLEKANIANFFIKRRTNNKCS